MKYIISNKLNEHENHSAEILPTIHNIIEYVQILTTGNALDFGDLTVARNNTAFVTNAHGGL